MILKDIGWNRFLLIYSGTNCMHYFNPVNINTEAGRQKDILGSKSM